MRWNKTLLEDEAEAASLSCLHAKEERYDAAV
jgi:hypothetical protein